MRDTTDLHNLVAYLAGGDLTPAETRVLEDEALDTLDGDVFVVATAIVADHREVDYDDVQEEVYDELDGLGE